MENKSKIKYLVIVIVGIKSMEINVCVFLLLVYCEI